MVYGPPLSKASRKRLTELIRARRERALTTPQHDACPGCLVARLDQCQECRKCLDCGCSCGA